MQQMQPPPEEKNIFRYRLRKRYDRYNRVMLERIFQEDDHDYTAHHKDYYRRNYSQRPKLITPEVADKLHNGKQYNFGKSQNQNHASLISSFLKNLYLFFSPISSLQSLYILYIHRDSKNITAFIHSTILMMTKILQSLPKI